MPGRADVSLNSEEITELNRIVGMWLDFAEDQATRRKQVFIQDWQIKLDEFLRFNDRNVLSHSGKVSKKIADEKAQTEYEQFAVQQRVIKEAQGEIELMQQLEAAIQLLPWRKRKGST